MFCTRGNLTSIIKKIIVEIGPKIEQSWVLSCMCRTEDKEDSRGRSMRHIPRGSMKRSCSFFCNLHSIHINFFGQFLYKKNGWNQLNLSWRREKQLCDYIWEHLLFQNIYKYPLNFIHLSMNANKNSFL